MRTMPATAGPIAEPTPGAVADVANEPVFIVGVSRSGTTLLASMLGAHSRIYCGPETFLFPRLASAGADRILRDPRWPARAVDFLASIRLGGSEVRVHELFDAAPDQLHTDLAAQPPSAAALLGALAGPRARAEGKERWAEKTPNHLLYLEDIRRHFPTAPIVRIVRDPRDVAFSLTKVPFGSQSKLANLYLWLERDERSWRFFERDTNSVTVRYEDLVANPSAELARICACIGETFEPQMLDTRSAAGLMTSIEWWKEQVNKPLDRTRVAAWQKHYTAAEAHAASVICGEALARYGYPHDGVVVQTRLFQPLSRDFVERHETVVTGFAARNIRLLPWTWRRAGLAGGRISGPALFWGQPEEMGWQLGNSTPRRLASIVDLAGFLAREVLGGRRPLAVRQPTGGKRETGLGERVCSQLLRLAARPVTRERAVGDSGQQ